MEFARGGGRGSGIPLLTQLARVDRAPAVLDSGGREVQAVRRGYPAPSFNAGRTPPIRRLLEGEVQAVGETRKWVRATALRWLAGERAVARSWVGGDVGPGPTRQLAPVPPRPSVRSSCHSLCGRNGDRGLEAWPASRVYAPPRLAVGPRPSPAAAGRGASAAMAATGARRARRQRSPLPSQPPATESELRSRLLKARAGRTLPLRPYATDSRSSAMSRSWSSTQSPGFRA